MIQVNLTLADLISIFHSRLIEILPALWQAMKNTLKCHIMKKSVGIIGAGWLGEVLAKTLLSRGFSIQTTSQSAERIEHLQESQIPVERFVLPFDFSQDDIASINVFSKEVLVVCIPPQLKKGRTDYPLKIENIVKGAELGQVKHLILLSTTAIYNGLSGKVSESSELAYDAEKVAILAEAENKALAFNGRSSILRLAGLIGPNRHPGGFFKRGRTLKDPDVAINLIHQRDVVELVMGLLQSDTCEGVYNGVSNTHMSKGEFYHLASQSLNADEKPIIKNNKRIEKKVTGKIVIGDKIRTDLQYQFCFDDLLQWLDID